MFGFSRESVWNPKVTKSFCYLHWTGSSADANGDSWITKSWKWKVLSLWEA